MTIDSEMLRAFLQGQSSGDNYPFDLYYETPDIETTFLTKLAAPEELAALYGLKKLLDAVTDGTAMQVFVNSAVSYGLTVRNKTSYINFIIRKPDL